MPANKQANKETRKLTSKQVPDARLCSIDERCRAYGQTTRKGRGTPQPAVEDKCSLQHKARGNDAVSACSTRQATALPADVCSLVLVVGAALLAALSEAAVGVELPELSFVHSHLHLTLAF